MTDTNKKGLTMNKIVLETVQRSRLLHIHDVAPLSDADYEVLREIGDVLRRHGRTDRFGVCLLHKHFDVSEDEELLEDTDEQQRLSTVRVVKAGATQESSIETMWRYSDKLVAGTKCVIRCISSGMMSHRKGRHEKVAV